MKRACGGVSRRGREGVSKVKGLKAGKDGTKTKTDRGRQTVMNE